eukprot:5725100-Karenia_brevis.AAC.1
MEITPVKPPNTVRYVSMDAIMALPSVQCADVESLELQVAELKKANAELETAAKSSPSWADISEPEPQPVDEKQA